MKSFNKNFASIFSTLNSQLSTSLTDQSGQILIIILLVLVVGVSIVLSLSARSITDLRTTTSTEQSNRAYFAAEAGIERALQQIKDGGITGSGNPISGQDTDLGSSGSQYSGTIDSSGGVAKAFYFTALKDTTLQVNLRTTVTDDTTGQNGGGVNIYWHTSTNPVAGDTAALEITLLRKNKSSGNYSIDKFACDPISSRASVDGFNCAGSVSGTNPAVSCGTTTLAGVSNSSINSFCFKATIPLNSSANEQTLLMRIRPIIPPPFTSTSEGIAVEYTKPIGTIATLPQQGYTITSTGVGKDGSNRKLVVFRSFPSLPTVFDFVLYNGSSNALQKP